MTEDFQRLAALEQLSYERLCQWDLSKRERLVANWIVRLSFGGEPRRGYVWLTGLLLSQLTGLHEPDVTTTVRKLEKTRKVLKTTGPRNGQPRRFEFLPHGELVTPQPAVEDAVRERVLHAIAALQVELGEEPARGGAQRRLAVRTTEEALSDDQVAASREMALEDCGIRNEDGGSEVARPWEAIASPEARRKALEGELSRLGFASATIMASRTMPLDGLGALVHERRGMGAISETLIGSRVAEELPAVSVSKSLIPSRSAHSQDSQTVDRTALAERSTVNSDCTAPALSESLILQSPKPADGELMAILGELVGPLWDKRDASGKGNWASLWSKALRSSKVAVQAAREAIASYQTLRRTRTVPNVGGFLWGAFRNIQSALLKRYRHNLWEEAQREGRAQ